MSKLKENRVVITGIGANQPLYLVGVSVLFLFAFQPVAIAAEQVPNANATTISSADGKDASVVHTKNENPESLTSTWLELQRSGSQASTHKQTLSGPVMENIYGRYKDSFKHPIPKVSEQNAPVTR